MIEAMVMSAVLATGPDYTQVNYHKPHKGAFSGIIIDAAKVPKKHRSFSACVLDRESGGNQENTNSG
jgi:hypothetical protein